MGLDLWGKEDIQNTLSALHQTMLRSGADGDYRRGFEAALLSTALAFGLNPRHDLMTLTEAIAVGYNQRKDITP